VILSSVSSLVLFDRGPRHRKCAVSVTICCPEIDVLEGERERERQSETDKQEGRFELPEPDFTADCVVTL
jgi:hypothetical protein